MSCEPSSCKLQAQTSGLFGRPEEAPCCQCLVNCGVLSGPVVHFALCKHVVDFFCGVAEVSQNFAVVFAEGGSGTNNLGGVLLEETKDILTSYFRKKRKKSDNSL